MRARLISRSRRTGRGMGGFLDSCAFAATVFFDGRAPLPFELEELVRAPEIAAILVVIAIVISPSGSAWTVTAPLLCAAASLALEARGEGCWVEGKV